MQKDFEQALKPGEIAGGCINRLEHECGELREASSILKKAMGFWCVDSSRKPRGICARISKKRGTASVKLCCEVLSIRREGYYDWLKRPTRTEA